MSQPTVAIIGASSQREKYGNKSVRAHLKQGYKVYPINPSSDEIEGLPVFRSIGDVPEEHLTRISMYVPASVGLNLLPAIAQKGCDEFWLNPGSESEDVIAEAKRLGLDPIVACSIVDVGESPRDFD